MNNLTLVVLEDIFSVYKLSKDSLIPKWAFEGDFCSVTRTLDELSIVCRDKNIPCGVQCERGWKGFKVDGTLDFGLIGILNSLTRPLANAGISIFAVSTFDTDYIFVKVKNFQKAVDVLKAEGFVVKKD